MNMPTFHRILPITLNAAPLLITFCTAIIFVVDLNFPIGFAPWLPYFVLAFTTARLYKPRTLFLATAFWSLAIMGVPLLHSEAGDIFAQGAFNRTIGVITLWILTGLLYGDIVARREKQATESRLQAIVQGALDAVVTIDHRGFVVEWNPQAETIFGFSRQEAIGKQLAELIIPPQYREAHAQGMQRFLSTGQDNIFRRRIEITALRKNGDEFPVELTVTPLHHGGQIFFSSFVRDISDRKRGEQKLQQSAAFIESMFEHLPNMVFVKEAKDLRFLRFNKACEELLGYSRSEVLGKNDYDFFPKEEADISTAKDHETLSSGVLVDIPEEPVRTKSKGLRILHTKKIPICDSNGTPQYLLGISEDITERKEAEAALVTARLAAEEATKTKSDFLAIISHEMRTPLNAIVGLSDFLLQTPLSSEQAALVTRCVKASDALLRMIEDLLLAAKAESGTLALVVGPFDLEEVVAEATELLVTDAHDKGLSLTLHMDPDVPTHVIGDAHRLEQVLLNLIRNAIKFTPTGSVTVHVAAVSQQNDRTEVLFRVVDTGVGIPPEQQERIFERFSQADSRTARQYSGMGLGLSICKQLVKLMGGRIWVESSRGLGSRFLFTVRLKVVPADTTNVSPTRSNIPSQQTVQTHPRSVPAHGLNILLAEDCVESQDVMRLYLRDSPHHLDCATTGSEVVAQYKAKHYDLVFMDLNMPDVDGYTATRLIRTWEVEQGHPPTPIIALTANGSNEARQESQAAGCNDFLTKPIKMGTVLQAIQRYSSGSAETAPVQPPSLADGGNQSVVDELVLMKPKFIRNRYRDVATLQAAITEKHFAEIRTIGHHIKGLAGSYGEHDIGAIGGAIEQAALNCDIETLTAQVSRLGDALRDAEQTCSIGSKYESHAA